jgi:hypothetical protein
MQFPRVRDAWRLSAAYFVVVGCMLVSAAFIPARPVVGHRLVLRQSDTITVSDVVASAGSGKLAESGVVLLVLVGPVVGIFRNSSLSAAMGSLLLLTAVLLFRCLRLGAFVGAAWSLAVLLLLVVALAQISISYSFAARLLMFGPASAFNLALLISLGSQVKAMGTK